jgi:hypothetical protein
VGQTIVFCGLPGCEAARFRQSQEIVAPQRFSHLVVQASACTFRVTGFSPTVGQTIVFSGLPGKSPRIPVPSLFEGAGCRCQRRPFFNLDGFDDRNVRGAAPRLAAFHARRIVTTCQPVFHFK